MVAETVYGVDFGAAGSLAIQGPNGLVGLPKFNKVTGGAAVSDRFIRVLPLLLNGFEDKEGNTIPPGDVVVESATVGSSGVEPEHVKEVVENSDNNLYVLSNRATKNYKKDHGIVWDKGARYISDGDEQPVVVDSTQNDSHKQDAKIIYVIATNTPERLKLWRMPEYKFHRKHTSVRPYDKRNYRGEVPEFYLSKLPPYETIPDYLQFLLGNNYGKKNACYSLAKVMPFVMALDESGADTRDGYEKIIGLYEHGYPSFYRRSTVDLMQKAAKDVAKVDKIEEVTQEQRKEAWKITRRSIRQIYHLLKNN